MFFYRENAEKVMLLTKAQKSILLLDQMSNSVPIFNEAVAFRGEGEIDLDIFEKSVNLVIQRHDALRTIINVTTGEQIVLGENRYKLEIIEAEDKNVDELISNQIYTRYSYEKPLFRISLIRQGKVYYLVIAAHHIIVDGWSVGIIYKELRKAYNALIKNEELSFNKTMQFDEYISAMDKIKENNFKPHDNEKNKSLYMDLNVRYAPNFGGYEGNRHEVKIDCNVMKKLKDKAKALDSNASNLMLAIFAGVLYQVTNLKMIRIGMPVAGQNIVSGARTVIGDCVEMTGINIDMSQVQSIKDITKHIDEQMLQSRKDGYIDLENKEEGFNVVFNRNIKVVGNNLGQVEMKYYPIEVKGVKYDFFCSIVEFNNDVFLRFDYNTNKLSLDIVKVWSEYYLKMLELEEQDLYVPLQSLSIFEQQLDNHIVSYTELKAKCGDRINDWQINKDEEIELLVINEQQNICGIEIQGELYIKNNQKLIKSNMRAKYNTNGEVIILGSPEQLITVNQRNISLYIIEQRLQEINQIHKAVCEYDESSKLIKAYVEIDPSITYIDEIVKALSGHLPKYMIPSVFYRGLSGEDHELIPFREQIIEGKEKEIADILSTLLNNKNITLNDDFFELGGNSLVAMKLVQEIERIYYVKINPINIFKQPLIGTILKNIVEEIEERKEVTGAIVIPKVEEKEYYAVSAAQKSQYILQRLVPDKTNYNIAYAVFLEGEIQLERLKESIKQIVKKHESLRTFFGELNGEVIQYIQKDFDIDIEYEEKTSCIDEELYIEKEAECFIKPFDLSHFPLFRIKLIKLEAKRYVMLFDIHHIIFDGASGEIFAREFMTAYLGGELGELEIQYKDYAMWQRQSEQMRKIEQEEGYWLQVLSGDLPQLELKTDYMRPLKQSFNGDRVSFSMDEILTKAINEMCKQYQITPYMFFLSAINIFLSKHSGQEDIIVGTPVEGRNASALNSLIGMFVNTLPMRNQVNPNQLLIEFMQGLRENALKALEHSDIQLERIVELLHLERDISRNPLFDVMYTFQNNRNTQWQTQQLKIRSMDINTKNSKVDLFFEIQQIQDQYHIHIEYNTDLYRMDTINKFKVQFEELVHNMLEHIESPISEISLLTKEETNQLLYEFNNTTVPFRDDVVVQEIFEEQVKKHPEQIAAMFKEESISFDKINQKANRLARYLRNIGVTADTIVAIYMERSLEMMISILGVLKAGGAYLPIATDYPEDRVRYMLENSKAKAVLISGSALELEDLELPIVDLNKMQLEQYSSENLEIINKPNDLAYIIYTSGTTGKPKGVMIEHRALINRLNWMQKAYPICKEDYVLQKTTYTFDVSVWELVWWALEGATVVFLEPNYEKEPDKIARAIKKYGITTMHFVPSMLNAFLEYVEETKTQEMLSSLRQVFASGEALKPDHVNRFNKLLNNTKLINLYGPTEATIDVTYFNCFQKENIEVVPIGKPIDNIKLYVLDKQHKLVPIGANGELYISGVGVARGYLNNEELTTQRFIDNPFETNSKMYKTGDLVRWMPDGNIEYLGRLDHQVKIRGFRIELGEIEKVLLKLDGIKQASVVVKERKENKFLVAYYTGIEEYDTSMLKKHLKSSLPDYMVPAYIIQMDEMPITHNGKLNTKMLPEPEDVLSQEGTYVPAITEQEKLIAQVWSDVLGIKKIGIEDDFFSLGGDSIKAIQICSRLSSKQVKCTVKDLFEHTTIKELIEYIVFDVIQEENTQEAAVGEIALTPIQKWFFEQQFEVESHWNQSVMLHTLNTVDVNVLEKSLSEVIKHHDTLRIAYTKDEDKVVQYYRDINERVFELSQKDYYGYKNAKTLIKEACEKLQESMDLKEQLIKVNVFNTDEGDYIFIAIHHLIVDGVSCRIILEDLADLYAKGLNHKEMSLPRKTNSYSEWSTALYEYAQSSKLETELDYWKEVNAQISKVKSFDTVPLVADIAAQNKMVSLQLDLKDTQMLLQDVNKAYHTEINDILVTALARAVQRWYGGDLVALSLEGHGREEIIDHMDITRTVGWFTSKYPIVLDFTQSDSMDYCIKYVKETLRKVPNKGIGYGILKYLANKQDVLKHIPQLSFNYLGDLETVINNQLFEEAYIETENNVSEANHKIYDIDINAYILKGNFHIEIQYKVNQYFESSIKELAECLRKQLTDLIYFCVEKETVELTVSDYDDELLSLEELEDIRAQISDLM